MNGRNLFLPILLVLAVGVLVVCPFCGMTDVPVSTLWGGTSDDPAVRILWQLRLPRVLTAFLAGSGLALAGMAMQAMFRNPLATPYTLGIASGASLAAVASVYFGLTFTLGGFSSRSLSAFLGALGTIGLVYGLARRKREFSITTLLLAGIALSFFFSSLILLFQYLGDPNETYRMIRWMMGGLDRVVGFGDLSTLLPLVAVGSILLAALTNELNLLATGEVLAAARGVSVNRTRKLIFFAASLVVGGVVSVCGPISFVGLIVPHITRLLVGPDHRRLTPATLLMGGIFLTVCDTFARLVLAPAELPVGILTALLGGPFFLGLLLRNRA